MMKKRFAVVILLVAAAGAAACLLFPKNRLVSPDRTVEETAPAPAVVPVSPSFIVPNRLDETAVNDPGVAGLLAAEPVGLAKRLQALSKVGAALNIEDRGTLLRA